MGLERFLALAGEDREDEWDSDELDDDEEDDHGHGDHRRHAGDGNGDGDGDDNFDHRVDMARIEGRVRRLMFQPRRVGGGMGVL